MVCCAGMCRCVRVSVRVCKNIYTTTTYVYICLYVHLSTLSLRLQCPNYAKQLLANAKAASSCHGGGAGVLGENKHILPSLHTVLIAWPNDFLIANQFQQLANQHDPAIVAN